MAHHPSPLLASVFALAALFVALHLLGGQVSAARTVPSGGVDGQAVDDGLEDLASLLSIRRGSEAQILTEGGQDWTNPCGGFQGSEPGESEPTTVHEPCFGPGGELAFCCLSGKTGCSCPPWALSDTNFGCYNYEQDNTLNAFTGSECGHFLPAHLPQGAARSDRTLTVTNTTLTGVISVTRADDNSFVGYVNKTFVASSLGRFGITSNPGQALLVSVPTGSGVALTMLNGPASSYPYLGFVVGPASSSDDLMTGSSNSALLAATSPLAPNSVPSQIGNSYSGRDAETSVWTSQAGFNVLTPTWINTNSSAASTILVYSPSISALLITGSVSTFNAASFSSDGYAVVFTII